MLAFCVGDVRDFVFPEGAFTHIIHAATEASAKLGAGNPQLMRETIVSGANRMAEFALHSGANKLLFTSSGAVYGRQLPTMLHVDEDSDLACCEEKEKSSYSEGKILAEKILGGIAGAELEVKIARCFAFVGPYLPLDAHFAIGNFIRAGLHKQPIIIKGNGTPYRSYLYAADLVIWLMTILFKGVNNRPYNVGSEKAISIAELAAKVARHFMPELEVNICQKPEEGKLPERYVPSTARGRSELGLAELINLDDAIEKTKNWNARL